MKVILKTIKPINNIDYNEMFNSEQNIQIQSKLIPELQRALRPHFHPSVGQLTKWFNSLYKSRRLQSKLKSTRRITEDNHRVHNNGQIQDVNIKINKFIYIYFVIYHIY